MSIKKYPAIVFWLVFFGSAAFAPQRSEDSKDFFKKWLEEEVVHIITPEERDTFLKLTTEDEKEKFIEQFWLRRDSDPSTSANEYREEHYRRIAYANDHYHSGAPGWKSDRGRIYIRFGPPDSIQRFGPGETYVRPMTEGGGITKTFPFQIWRYRSIEGIGPDIEIEFVDTSLSNEYRLTIDPVEKDMLFYAGGGKTEYEELGMESRWMRNTRRGLATTYHGPVKNLPFEKLALLGKIDRPPPIRFEKLRTLVTTRVSYEQLPLRVRPDYLRIDENATLTLLNIQLDERNLAAQPRVVKQKTDGQANGVDPLLDSGSSKQASSKPREIQLYGRIQDVTGRTLHEFDAALNADPDKSGGLLIYQRPIVLAAGTYKLELAVRESESDLFGTHEERLQVPAPVAGLTVGPLMVAQEIVPVINAGDLPRPFELGDLRVIPRLDTEFARDEVLKLYFQAYNFELDAKSGQPAFSLSYYILKEGKQVKNFRDGSASSLQSASPESAVFASGINLKVLEPGAYRLIVRVKDKISGQEASSSVEFSVS